MPYKDPEKKKAYNKAYAEQNKAAISLYKREWARDKMADPQFRTKRLAGQAEWARNNPDKRAAIAARSELKNGTKNKISRRNAQLKSYYGITLEEYEQLKASQEERCAICGVEAVGVKRGLFVDHDHETGLVRGLLCDNCNLGIARFKDSQELLQKACLYLQKAEQ